jgi:TolB-like protein/DNA-binding winged helix-turn-helix (wHTH) protein
MLSGELSKRGRKVILPGQAFEVLRALLARPGELVSREELRATLWPTDVHVDFERGLNKAVNKVRDVLGDSAEAPKYIETVPRRGYRFIAPIETEPNFAPQSECSASIASYAMPPGAQEPRTANVRQSNGRSNRRWTAAAAVAAILLAVMAVWADRSHNPSAPRLRSIAVLPLRNLSGDSGQEYFADGMTDELITDLAQIDSLKVVSQTSVMPFKQTKKSLPEIANELGVDAIVEGSVLQSNGNVRVTAQLLDARRDRHLWAASYERKLVDVVGLQRQVARSIADQVRAELTLQEQHN